MAESSPQWLQQVLSICNWFLSLGPYVVPMLLVGAGLLVGAHNYIKKAQIGTTSFGLVTYVAMLCSFNFELLRHVYATVVPVSGIVAVSDSLMQWACGHIIDFGPIRMVSLQFVSSSLLLTPVLLLPPRPSASPAPDPVASRAKQKTVGAGASRKKAGCCENSLLRVYVLGSSLLLLSAGAVYRFAERHNEDIERDFQNAWFIISTAHQDGAAQPIASPALVTLMYSVLAIAKLIILYERVMGSSFLNDFPMLMLMRAFPCFSRCTGIVGQLAALAAKGNKLAECARRAWAILEAARIEVPKAHAAVRGHFDAAKARVGHQAVTVSQSGAIPEAAFAAAETLVRKAVGVAVHDLCRQLADPKTPEDKSLVAFFEFAQEIFRDLKASDTILPGGCLPGDKEFESRLTAITDRAVTEFFESLRDDSPHFAGEGSSEMASTWLTGMSDQAVEKVGGAALSGVDVLLKELRDLALHAGVPRSVVDRAYNACMQFEQAAKVFVNEDLGILAAEAERVVELAEALPFLARWWWVWVYDLIGVALGLLVWVNLVISVSALVHLAASWSDAQFVAAIFWAIPLLTFYGFVMYFWFTACKPAVLAAQPGQALSTAKKVLLCVVAAIPLALAVAAGVALIVTAVQARQSDVYNRCMQLLPNSTSSTLV